MKLGIFSPEIPRDNADALFAALRSYGFEEVQFDCLSLLDEEMPKSISPEFAKNVARAARENGVRIVAINGTFNMIHPDRAERLEGVERFRTLARATDDFGCKFITLCTGSRNPDNMWVAHPDNTSEAAWQDLVETMKMALEIADEYDLTLGLETEDSNCLNTAERTERLIREMGSPRLRVILDIANLFSKGKAHKEYVREVMDDGFNRLMPYIYLAHGKDIKDTDGIAFTHAGNGIVDFRYFFERLKEAGYAGGMLLHGIKDEQDIPAAVDYIKRIMEEVGV